MSDQMTDIPDWLAKARADCPEREGWDWDAMRAAQELLNRLDGTRNADVTPIIDVCRLLHEQQLEMREALNAVHRRYDGCKTGCQIDWDEDDDEVMAKVYKALGFHKQGPDHE